MFAYEIWLGIVIAICILVFMTENMIEKWKKNNMMKTKKRGESESSLSLIEDNSNSNSSNNNNNKSSKQQQIDNNIDNNNDIDEMNELRQSLLNVIEDNNNEEIQEAKYAKFLIFQRKYLIVILLAFLADWLQGPYLYLLYQSTYDLPNHTISFLYMSGFLSALVGGSIVGSLADKYGRKRLCITFSILYICACTCTLFGNVGNGWGIRILFLGRFLSGIATSLLFSSFESWMVSEHFKHGFEGEWLNSTFGYMYMGNGIVAVMAGLISKFIADEFGCTGPFVFAMVPLVMVFVLVNVWFDENYGDSSAKPWDALYQGGKYLMENPGVMCLGLGEASFEGAMYVFVFLYTPALKALDPLINDKMGIIFASFMVCSMVGAAIFRVVCQFDSLLKLPFVLHSLSVLAFITGTIMINNLFIVFISFLIFETCVGMFYPSYGRIKAMNIPENVRAGVMNIFRIPLNIVMTGMLYYQTFNPPFQTTFKFSSFIHATGFLAYFAFYIWYNRKQKNDMLNKLMNRESNASVC